MATHPHILKQLDEKKQLVQRAVRDAADGMIHAFLWGTVEVKLKNKKSKYYRVCLGGIRVSDLNEVVKLAESVPGVSQVYYNLD
jgi:hypothetical protein